MPAKKIGPPKQGKEKSMPSSKSDEDAVPQEIDSKYRLILLAAQRAKQLQRGAAVRIDIDAEKHKSTRIALEEVMRGRVNFVRNDQRDELPQQKLAPNEEYVALALIGDKIKLVSLSPDGQYKFLDERDSLHDFIYVSGLSVSNLQGAIEELEWLVNNPKAREKDFQDFFNRNKDFILNDEYKDAHSHVVFTSDKGESMVPDFVLEPVDQNSLCDLLELKLPSARLFTLKKNRMRYSAAVAEACAQLREYGRYFEEEKNRKVFLDKYGLRAYKPKMFVIIGRRSTVDPLDERNVQTDLPNLHLRTYDDIINRMKWRAEKMQAKSRGDRSFRT
jgi:DNA-directed RNA polymerase omega subunit